MIYLNDLTVLLFLTFTLAVQSQKRGLPFSAQLNEDIFSIFFMIFSFHEKFLIFQQIQAANNWEKIIFIRNPPPPPNCASWGVPWEIIHCTPYIAI